jgi:4-hydroxybenzoate polyprenyltransferase
MVAQPSDQVIPSAKKQSVAGLIGALIAGLRPMDWIKNLFVLAPFLFSGHLFMFAPAVKSLLGFTVFCILSSGTYLFNDLMDREEDRHHPGKALRPIASGRLSVSLAGVATAVLMGVGLVGAFALDSRFGMIALGFSLLQFGYSLGLKDWVIVDVLLIAAGFVLRVLGGSVLVAVIPSAWIILCTVLLSLFLGFSKRRHELVVLEAQAVVHRRVLKQYSLAYLDQMISAVLAATVVSYALYAVANGPYQVYSVFFVLYAMFRYAYLIHRHGQGAHAAESFFSDRPLFLAVVAWALFMFWDIYLRA